MASILQAVSEKYRVAFYEKTDPRVREWFLMPTPFGVLILTTVYIYFVKVLGPKLMEHRKPIDVKKLMVLYNTFQILMNGYLLYKAGKFAISDVQNILCSLPNYTFTPEGYLAARTTYLFFISRVIDIIDTIFMVLRKKFNQITFLHVYHHSAMMIIGWLFSAYYPGGHAVYFGVINCFVHVIMYSYYLATAIFPEYSKSAWWKRHLTQLQLVQFVLVTVHSTVIAINPNCNYPNIFLPALIPQGIIMYTLFWDFYKKAYSKKNIKETNNIEKID